MIAPAPSSGSNGILLQAPNGATRGPRSSGTPQILGPDGLPYRKDYGDYALPHVLGFAAILGSAYKTYYHLAFDEAWRHDRQDPLVMRQDAFLMGLLQERKLAVASLPWHLEVPDEKDQKQVMVRDTLTKALKGVWGLRRFIWEMLDAIWYGRMGEACEWKWEVIDGQRVLTLDRFFPINGDKIGHRYDGTPYVLVNAALSDKIEGAAFIYSTLQKGLLLEGNWAEHVLVHHHHRVDADFFDADRAEAIHGLGIRSDLFWINWIRLEWQSRISDFVDRVGLGLTVWYFEQGNPASYTAVKKAAEEQSGKMNILLPCPPGQTPGKGTGVQRIETPATGADLLNRIIEPLRSDIERYVVGQEASSKSDGSKGLGNEAGAEFQQDTKFNITQFDAWLLADMITGCARSPGVVSVMKRWSFPWADFPVNFVFGAERPQTEKKLDGAKTIYDMKIPLKADEVRAAGGFSKPGPGDETVQAPEQTPGGEGGEGTPSQLRPGGKTAGIVERANARQTLAGGQESEGEEKPGESADKPPEQSAKQSAKRPDAPRVAAQRAGEPAQYYDPAESRDKSGKWTSGGGGSASDAEKPERKKGLLARAGKAGRAVRVGKVVEHRVLQSIKSHVPERLQQAARLAVKGVFSSWLPAQAAAKAVAREVGGERYAKKVGRLLIAGDLAAAKTIAPAVGAIAGPGAGAVAYMTPLVSSAYLAYSSLRHPQAAYEAAKKAVLAVRDKINVQRGAVVQHARDVGEGQWSHEVIAALLRGFDRAGERGDWYEVLVYAALEATEGDLAEAVKLADAAMEQRPPESHQMARADAPEQYEAHHAPVGGVTIQGTTYTGGEFIPADVVAKASAKEKAKLLQVKQKPASPRSDNKKGKADKSQSESKPHPGAAHGSHVKVTVTKEMAAPRDAKGRVKTVPVKTKLSKQETGRVAEAGIRAYLRDIEGISDTIALNSGKANESIDLFGDSMAPEVKGGLCSNTGGAQQWRITFSMELGKKEQAQYDALTPEQQKAWREKRQRACLTRKLALLKQLSKERGKPIKPVTFTGIVNPDTQTIDIYRTEGYHQRIGWNDPQAKHVASVKYDHPD